MKRSAVVALFVMLSVACGLMGCKSWAPIEGETGKCSQDRQWVPAQQDPNTGEWKEGHCEWLPGKG